MSETVDQCGHCTNIGDYIKCESDVCAVHTSWYCKEVVKQLDDLRRELTTERESGKQLICIISSAIKTSEFEKHPFRPWHKEARDALNSGKE